MILKKILDHKEAEVRAARIKRPLQMLRERISGRPPVRGFLRALKHKAATSTAVIAEVKKGSPSKGVIREDFDPVAIARAYEDGGAACLSVLTDERFFLGHLDFMSQVADEVFVPVLRKDFLVDSYQIYEARAFGADAVLLIVSALPKGKLKDLALEAKALDLDVLVEVHDAFELETSLEIETELIGINNRDLKSFHTDLAVTEKLLPLIPDDRFVVSESGIHTREDIERLSRAGAKGFLIGESLMRERNVAKKLAALLSN